MTEKTISGVHVHVSPGSTEALIRTGGITNYHLIAHSLGNISAKNYPNRLMCVEVIVCYISVVFSWDTVYNVLVMQCCSPTYKPRTQDKITISLAEMISLNNIKEISQLCRLTAVSQLAQTTNLTPCKTNGRGRYNQQRPFCSVVAGNAQSLQGFPKTHVIGNENTTFLPNCKTRKYTVQQQSSESSNKIY